MTFMLIKNHNPEWNVLDGEVEELVTSSSYIWRTNWIRNKLLQQVEKVYRDIAEEDKRLCEDFLNISLETIENDF